MAGRTIEETARIVHSSKSSVVAVKKTLGTKLHHLQRGRKPILTYREIEDLKIQCMSDKCLVAADCITYCWGHIWEEGLEDHCHELPESGRCH